MLISGTPEVKKIYTSDENLYHHVVKKNFDSMINIFSEITVQSKRIMNEGEAASIIDNMITESIQTKKPCYLEIPYNLQTVEIEAPHYPLDLLSIQSSKQILNAALNHAIEIIKKSKTRNILAGYLIDREKLNDILLSIIDKLGASVVSTLMGKHGDFENHPSAAGMYLGTLGLDISFNAVEKADVIINAGTVFDEFDTGWFTAPKHENNVITILQDHVIVNEKRYNKVYIRDFLNALNKAVQDIQPTSPSIPKDGKKFIYDKEKYSNATDNDITIDRMIPFLGSFFRSDDVIFGDAGGFVHTSQTCLPKGSVLYGNGNWGSIGNAFAFLVGATFGKDQNKRYIGVIGDGSFQLTAQEVSTLIKYDRDVIIFILNNGGYGLERGINPGKYRSYNDIGIWKYHQLPETFGSKPGVNNGFEVRTEKELVEVLKKLENSKGVTMVNIHLDPADMPEFLIEFGKKWAHEDD